jgi:tetratricopeptide (TPR) repeat protein
MLISRITRILFWTSFGIVTAATLGLLLLYAGIVDELLGWPENAGANALKLGWLIDKIKTNKDPIDLAIKVIGLAFSVIIGTLAFLVKWYNSSLNFPLRLAEYAARLKRTHFMGRATVLAPFASRNLAGESFPATTGIWAYIRPLLGFDFLRAWTIQRSVAYAPAIDADVRLLNESLGLTRSRRVTIHLLKGCELAREGSAMEPGGQQLAQHEAAMSEFKKAVELDPFDADALELSARQSKLLSKNKDADSYLERLHGATLKMPTRHARALRYQAELLEEKGTKAALQNARVKLDTALEALQTPGTEDEKPLELALTNEQLAALHIKRGTPTLVRPYLDEARQQFLKLTEPLRTNAVSRLDVIETLLDRALRGVDETDEPEREASHITLDIVDVVSEPKEGATVTERLPAYAGVAVLQDKNGWSEIARGSRRLGYVATGSLTAVM